MLSFKEYLQEEKEYHSGEEVLNAYLKNEITLKRMKEIADTWGRQIATKKMLQDFLNNKFMIGVMSDTTGVKESVLVSKVKKMIKGLF